MDPLINIEKLGDIELLELLCSESKDDHLYAEFVNRFLPTIQKECLKKCKVRKIDSHVGIQISHEIFERVKKYKSFKKDNIRLKDDHKGIIVYLLRISLSLFNDHYRKQKASTIAHKTYFDDIFETVSVKMNVNELKNKKEIALYILKNLNGREQKVILTDIEYKKHFKYLPDDVTETLSIEMGVKKDTIRKIRKRAIEKINNLINEINTKESHNFWF